jgi:hypothetical protein
MSGQLALVIDEEALVPAAVWETLPVECRVELTRRLARLLARLVEAPLPAGHLGSVGRDCRREVAHRLSI